MKKIVKIVVVVFLMCFCYLIHAQDSIEVGIQDQYKSESLKIPDSYFSTKEKERSSITDKKIEERAKKIVHRWFQGVREIQDRDKKEKELIRVVKKLNRKIDKALRTEISSKEKQLLIELKEDMIMGLSAVRGKGVEELDAFANETEKEIVDDKKLFWTLVGLAILGLGAIVGLILIIF